MMDFSSRSVPRLLAVLMALTSGLLALGNYFFGLAIFTTATQFVLKVTVLTSGAALLMAALHLAVRHVTRARHKDVGSLLLVLGFVLMFVAGLAPGGFGAGLGGWLYRWLLVPGMAALFALLPIFLAYALFRHLSVRDTGGVLFLLGLVIVLMGQTPALATKVPALAGLRHSLLIGPVAAAFRGVILGLSLGALMAIILKVVPRSGLMRRAGQQEDEA